MELWEDNGKHETQTEREGLPYLCVPPSMPSPRAQLTGHSGWGSWCEWEAWGLWTQMRVEP